MVSQTNEIIKQNSVRSFLEWAFLGLNKVSDSPFLDAEILLARVIKKEKEFLYIHPEKSLTAQQIKKFKQIINRRKKREPVAYILGYKEFYGLKFQVNKYTLIPRPETEMIVKESLNCLDPLSEPALLIDVGTGSGCIPIAIAKNIKKSVKIFATDISAQALKIAKKNAKINKVNKKIKFLNGDLLEPLVEIIKNSVDKNIIITANLPYVPSSLYKSVKPDVKNYEPKLALDGGKDGLKYYRALFKQIKKIQTRLCNFYIICEIDPSQKNSITAFAKKHFPDSKIKTKKDLSGLNRLFMDITLLKKGNNG